MRVTLGAARNAVFEAEGLLRVDVTAVPEAGKANREVVRLLARALGVAKTTLTLVRGETSRDKVFRLEGGDQAPLRRSR